MAVATGNTAPGTVLPAQTPGACQFAYGSYTGDGNTGGIPINIGFVPRVVVLINVTDTKRWEWVEGLAATDSWYGVTGADPAIGTDTVVINSDVGTSYSEPGVYAPGTSETGDGTLINTTVEDYSPNLAETGGWTLMFGTAGSAAAPANVSAKVYVWYAFGS
jgi:hypothetical protein